MRAAFFSEETFEVLRRRDDAIYANPYPRLLRRRRRKIFYFLFFSPTFVLAELYDNTNIESRD